MNLTTLFAWLLTSSSDPKKYSLAAIGFVTFAGGYVLNLLPVMCMVGVCIEGVDQNFITALAEFIGKAIEAILMLIGAALAILGALRKIKLGRWAAKK